MSNWWKRHSGAVISVVELVGFVGTIFTTVKATQKCQEKLKHIDIPEDATFKEKAVITVRAVGRDCVTPLIFGTVTVGCMVGKQRMYASQQAAIASSYTMLKRMYDENRDKIEDVMNDISPLDHKNPSALNEVEESMNGDPKDRNDIFFLEYSGRRFKSSLADVEEALELLDQQFQKQSTVSFNDLYLYLGIAESKLGVENGFADMGRLNNPDIPKDRYEHIEWTIQKVTKATGLNAEESKKLEEKGEYIYMISFGNHLEHVAFYKELFEIENPSIYCSY